MPQCDYKSMSDDELIKLVGTDEIAFSELISRHLGTVRRLAHLYSATPSDCDDLISEGIIGLINAAKSYDSSRGAVFSTYAYACIHNKMLTALKRSSKIKLCEADIDSAGLEAAQSSSPESILIGKEELDEVMLFSREQLSKTERNVFELYMYGDRYGDISKKLGISPKSVDNAISRVRRKLRTKLR